MSSTSREPKDYYSQEVIDNDIRNNQDAKHISLSNLDKIEGLSGTIKDAIKNTQKLPYVTVFAKINDKKGEILLSFRNELKNDKFFIYALYWIQIKSRILKKETQK